MNSFSSFDQQKSQLYWVQAVKSLMKMRS